MEINIKHGRGDFGLGKGAEEKHLKHAKWAVFRKGKELERLQERVFESESCEKDLKQQLEKKQ